MAQLYDQIIREASIGAKCYNDEEEMIHIIFFPKLGRAWVEAQGRKYWFEASGINHALDQLEWSTDLEMSMAE